MAEARITAAKAEGEGVADGRSAAALLASGIGALFLGIFTLLAEASVPIKDVLNLYDPVGPLSGKTTIAVIIWLIAWGALYAMWRNKEVDFSKMYKIALILVALGFLLTFPPFFVLFAAPE